MKILVIGGTGFIGTPLVKKLLQAKLQVTVVARGRKAVRIPGVNLVRLYRKDIMAFQKRFCGEQFDVIYDLQAFTPRDVIHISEVFPPSFRYIMVSSAAIYGPQASLDITEQASHIPVEWHDYGRNKWLAEQEVMKYCEWPWVIVRPCVVYGPWDRHEPRASYFFHRIFHQVPLIIPGSKSIYNNYIYVEDLADLLIQCLDVPQKKIINAGGGEVFTWPQYLETLTEIMEMPLPDFRYLEMSLEEFRAWKYCKPLQFHHNVFHNFVLDINVAKSYGWCSQYSLKEGLADAWAWWKQHRYQEMVDAKAALEWEIKLWHEDIVSYKQSQMK